RPQDRPRRRRRAQVAGDRGPQPARILPRDSRRRAVAPPGTRPGDRQRVLDQLPARCAEALHLLRDQGRHPWAHHRARPRAGARGHPPQHRHAGLDLHRAPGEGIFRRPQGGEAPRLSCERAVPAAENFRGRRGQPHSVLPERRQPRVNRAQLRCGWRLAAGVNAMATVALLVPYHCALGENPLWDETKRTFYWTDIEAGEVHAWSEATGQTRRIYQGPKVGGFTLEADGALALFRIDDIARL